MKKTKEVPKGTYCAGYNGICCPYWSLRKDKPHQMNGYCSMLEVGDWMKDVSDLWDQVKMCNINEVYGDE